ncbi:hypothetical protein GGU10DRAFT_337289 [Lentinula aff. detonsa]|uniref:Uncharacterized protein n=1 Tax=Lentinula aff. detonsa TaxID=2804958 RepID=A0AA38NN67_9AGAR|nr:hypothetical protein GGU10DRAFT_337289 [Lentinula aff. detonsa]
MAPSSGKHAEQLRKAAATFKQNHPDRVAANAQAQKTGFIFGTGFIFQTGFIFRAGFVFGTGFIFQTGFIFRAGFVFRISRKYLIFWSSLPSITYSPTFPPVDLLSNVVGTQVDQSAETITWPNGWESVLPIGMKNSVNVLKTDVERMQWLACEAYQDNKSLIEDIQYLNAHNYTVVVPGDFHRLTTVSDFIKDANNPNVVGMILDVPTSRQSLPEPYHLLDESAAAFCQMKLDQSYKSVGSNTSFHIDTLFAPTWALLHHAGTYTNVHQDAGGYSVAGQVFGDFNDPQPKMWAIMTLKNPVAASQTPEKVAEQMASICR